MKVFSFFKLFVLTACLTWATASAQSVSVYMPDVNGAPGTTVIIPVSIYCDVDMTAFQVRFSTDLGVGFTSAEFIDRIDPSATTYIVPGGGIMAYNFNGIDYASLEAGNGEVVDIYLEIPADAEPGTHTMTLHDMMFQPIGTSGSGSALMPNDFTATLTVSSTTSQAYACYTPSNTTLTFYYDNLRYSRAGATYDLNTGNDRPGWYTDGHYSSVTRVVFNSSFANARPTTTCEWFRDMVNLQSITGIRYLNTSEVTNMNSMFYFCESLTGLDVSHFNTAKVTDMGWMFFRCSQLQSLDVSNFNTAKVTKMNDMFSLCGRLTNLDVSGFNTSHVTNMTSMFSNCWNLTSLDLSNFNTANVVYMHYMFYECNNLTSLDLSSFNTANVTSMYFMFSGCEKLMSLNVSSFNTAKVIEMVAMFSRCEKLTSLDLSSFNTAKVTNMNSMFWSCKKLTSLNLSGFNTTKVTGMGWMFENCSLLTTIFVGNDWSTVAVKNSEKMFKNCTKLVGGKGTTYDENHVDATYAHIDGGTSNPGYLTDAREAYACYTSSNTTLTFYYDTRRASRSGTTYDLNSGSGYPGWIDNNINRSMTRVVFDSSFAEARPTTTHEWFADMRVLQTIEGIGFLNTSEVTNMDYMFFYCQNLTSLDVSNFNTAKVTRMYSMFGGCSGLTSLDVSNFNTAKVTRMDFMFAACTALTSLDLSSFNTAKVTNMSDMFYNCENLRTIYVGSGWNTDAVSQSSEMFDYCTKLVGCKGTTYDANHVDKAYAHIDGGTSNPGYLSRLILGDINGDGKVDVSDITVLIGVVLNGTSCKMNVADLNGDGRIDVSDVTALIGGVLSGELSPDNPRNSGVWLVLLDRDGSEMWYTLYLGTEGTYATTVSLYTSVYGTGRAKFYIVDNGFAYGAPQANQAVVLGDSDSNPLSRGKNYYTVPAGYSYTLGMTFDSNGERCVYSYQGPACN